MQYIGTLFYLPCLVASERHKDR